MLRNQYISAAIAVCMMAICTAANAADNDDALLRQVTQIASQGQSAQTAAAVQNYVNSHSDIISAILKGYLNYIKQVEAAAADDENAPATQTGGTEGQAASTGVAPQQPNGESLAMAASSRSTSGIQTAQLQPSGELRTSHLAGFPALPDVEPTDSIKTMSETQAAYAAKVRRENEDRKEYLMAHSEGYTY